MAVATPVLERKINTEERVFEREKVFNNGMTADEMHNSQISANYARLINPECKVNDIIVKEVRVPEQIPVSSVEPESLYLVENARADADIFRADSPVNNKTTAITVAEATSIEEEENEDLRPTQTTIQYKTAGVKKNIEEGKIDVKTQSKKLHLTKNDKIIIAVALTVIIALFVLIIVNSAVISNLSSDVSILQDTLSTVQGTYEETLAEKTAYFDESNLYQVVSEFATSNGMVLR